MGGAGRAAAERGGVIGRGQVFKERYADLPEYLHGFVYCCAVMQGAPSLERVAYEFAQAQPPPPPPLAHTAP